jgi:hypothetical protein
VRNAIWRRGIRMKSTIDQDANGIKLYTLKGRELVRADQNTFITEVLDRSKRQILHTQVLGKIDVVTFFLGMNHGASDDDPLFFETTVFGGKFDSQAFRTATYDEAEAMHHAIVDKIRNSKRAWYS